MRLELEDALRLDPSRRNLAGSKSF